MNLRVSRGKLGGWHWYASTDEGKFVGTGTGPTPEICVDAVTTCVVEYMRRREEDYV